LIKFFFKYICYDPYDLSHRLLASFNFIILKCKDCEYCAHPRTNLCQKIRITQGKGLMPDGTTRFSMNGQPIYHYMGTSCFSEYTVVCEISLTKVDFKEHLKKELKIKITVFLYLFKD